MKNISIYLSNVIVRRKTFLYLFSFALFIVLLSGCTNNDKTVVNHYYLSLMGESENWKVTGYEVVITPNRFKAGDGTLVMNNKEDYYSNFLNIQVHALIEHEDKVIQAKSILADATSVDISETTIGTIEGEPYINAAGEPITIENIGDIYMVVEWYDESKGEKVKERIQLLYEKP